MNTILKSALGIVGITMLSACASADIEGNWIEQVPGMQNQVQGISLEAGGHAASINMATLQYNKWEKKDNRLVLYGESIGNHETITFTDTFSIVKLSKNELDLKKGNLIIKYSRK